MHAASTTPEMPGFVQTQFAFAAAVRDPQHAPSPVDVPADRLAIYQELVFNNIEEFLSNAFPVLRRISSQKQWHTLVRDFIVEYRARTPLFPEMPREFLDYLIGTRVPREGDFPFLLELAHYEWTELAVAISEAENDKAEIDPNGSLLHGIPVLSAQLRLCTYRFPVHRISPTFIPALPDAASTHLLVYRDREDAVQFLELNPATARLLQRLEANTTENGESLLKRMATELKHPNPKTVIAGGVQILAALRAKEVILGSRR